MYYAARIAKEKHPDAKVVFVGPCVAKRKEARRDEAVDYILLPGGFSCLGAGTQQSDILFIDVRHLYCIDFIRFLFQISLDSSHQKEHSGRKSSANC